MAANAYILVSVDPVCTRAVAGKLQAIAGAMVHQVLVPCDFIVDLEAGLSKWDASSWHNSMRTGSWIDRYDVGLACVKALGLGLQGHQVFHLVGADSARTRFDVERTEMALGIELTSDFDRRHASERGGDQTSKS